MAQLTSPTPTPDDRLEKFDTLDAATRNLRLGAIPQDANKDTVRARLLALEKISQGVRGLTFNAGSIELVWTKTDNPESLPAAIVEANEFTQEALSEIL